MSRSVESRREFIACLEALGLCVVEGGPEIFTIRVGPTGANAVLELPDRDWSGFVAAFPNGFAPRVFADEVAREFMTSVRPIARAGVRGGAGVFTWFTERAPSKTMP